MDCSDKRQNLPLPPAPACSHRQPFHHHQCLEISTNCPQHGGYLFRPNTSHHHHHIQLSPDCPLHGHLLPPHFPLHAISNCPPNPNFNNLNYISHEAGPVSNSQPLNEQVEEEEEDDEEEIVFVLTDEWKEFFAKSEAKRKLAKKQAKKKGKD